MVAHTAYQATTAAKNGIPALAVVLALWRAALAFTTRRDELYDFTYSEGAAETSIDTGPNMLSSGSRRSLGNVRKVIF
jgi:hypothetical protein